MNAIKPRPLLYVCAPFRTRTLEEARATHAAIARALELGWAPVFGPLLLRDFLSDANPNERAAAIECDLAILRACNAVLVVGDRVTEGMRHELEAWRKMEAPGWPRAARWVHAEPWTLATLHAAPLVVA